MDTPASEICTKKLLKCFSCFLESLLVEDARMAADGTFMDMPLSVLEALCVLWTVPGNLRCFSA